MTLTGYIVKSQLESLKRLAVDCRQLYAEFQNHQHEVIGTIYRGQDGYQMNQNLAVEDRDKEFWATCL